MLVKACKIKMPSKYSTKRFLLYKRWLGADASESMHNGDAIKISKSIRPKAQIQASRKERDPLHFGYIHNQLLALQGMHIIYGHGSPNQVNWVTSLHWFQWNRPISVKKRVLVTLSVFFSPIIILFFQYLHKRSSHVPEIWPIQGLMFNILFQTR